LSLFARVLLFCSNVLRVYEVATATLPPPPKCSVPTKAGVHVCLPAANATVTSPVAISAANGGTKPSLRKAYVEGKQIASRTLAQCLSATAAGTYTLNVNAWNSARNRLDVPGQVHRSLKRRAAAAVTALLHLGVVLVP
jgi:hypothetical protein